MLDLLPRTNWAEAFWSNTAIMLTQMEVQDGLTSGLVKREAMYIRHLELVSPNMTIVTVLRRTLLSTVEYDSGHEWLIRPLKKDMGVVCICWVVVGGECWLGR